MSTACDGHPHSQVAKALVHDAIYTRRTRDNVTCVIVSLKRHICSTIATSYGEVEALD